MDTDEPDWTDWKQRIEVVRSKRGRTLTTGVLHVDGNEPIPSEALFLALANWQGNPVGQIVRRPDENGKQVYWVNIFN